MARDAALLRIHVMKVRETVMDLEMEVSMMNTEDVKEILFVDPTIASSLEPTSIPRMTVVKDHLAVLSASQTGKEKRVIQKIFSLTKIFQWQLPQYLLCVPLHLQWCQLQQVHLGRC